MNIIFWNIRGIGNNDLRVAFRDMSRLNNPSDGSVINFNSSCGGIFRDFRGIFLVVLLAISAMGMFMK